MHAAAQQQAAIGMQIAQPSQARQNGDQAPVIGDLTFGQPLRQGTAPARIGARDAAE